MNYFRGYFSGKKQKVPYDDDNSNGVENSEENGSPEARDSESEDMVIDDINELSKLSNEQIESLCQENEIPTGKRFEMMGRLLDFFHQNLSPDDLLKFSHEILVEMCDGRGLPNTGTDEQLAKDICKSVLGDEKSESENTPTITRRKNAKIESKSEIKTEKKYDNHYKDTPKKTPSKSLFHIPSFLGKRNRTSITEFTPIKKRKLSISSNEFMKKAKPIKIRIDGNYYDVEPRSFKGTKGTFGWYHNGRQKVEVKGDELEVAWNLNITVIDSK